MIEQKIKQPVEKQDEEMKILKFMMIVTITWMKMRRRQIILSLLSEKLILKMYRVERVKYIYKKVKLLLRLTWLRDYKSKLMRKLFNKSNWKIIYNKLNHIEWKNKEDILISSIYFLVNLF